MSAILNYEEACILYNEMKFYEETQMHKSIIETAAEYVQMRAKSDMVSDKNFVFWNNRRTATHDILIEYVNELYEIQKAHGCNISWMEVLGDDRKRIGDFACWLILFKGLDNR